MGPEAGQQEEEEAEEEEEKEDGTLQTGSPVWRT